MYGCCKMWMVQFLVLFIVQHINCTTQEPDTTLVVRTVPPGPVYPAATWILFTCNVENRTNSASLLYEWYGSSSIGGLQLLSDNPNLDGDRSATLWYLSTDMYEFQYIHCLAFNESDIMVADADVLLNVTGVGVHLDDLASVQNNTSIINPDQNDSPLTLFCQSASRYPCGTGLWVNPNGTPISSTPNRSCNSTTDSFITARLSVSPELSSGLYSCVIPDEDNESRILYIGIYSNLEERVMPFKSDLLMTHQANHNHLILSCTTSQLPSFMAYWERDGVIMNSSRPALLDVTNAEYSARIEVDWNSLGVVILSCLVYTEWIYPDPFFDHPDGVSANGNFIIAELGASLTITCTTLNGLPIEWLDGNRESLVSTGLDIREQTLTVASVTGDLHNVKFQCVGRDFMGFVQVWNHYTIVVSAPSDIVMVTLIGNTSEPAVVGDQYNVTCCYALKASLPTPALEWYGDRNKIEVGSEFNISTSEQCSMLTLKNVREEHRGSRYSCQVEWSLSLLFVGNATSHTAETVLIVEDLETTTDGIMLPTSAAKRLLSLVHLLTISLLLSALIIYL